VSVGQFILTLQNIIFECCFGLMSVLASFVLDLMMVYGELMSSLMLDVYMF